MMNLTGEALGIYIDTPPCKIHTVGIYMMVLTGKGTDALSCQRVVGVGTGVSGPVPIVAANADTRHQSPYET